MSRNAVAAMAVVFVSGFAGCAATSRAAEPPAALVEIHPATAPAAPLAAAKAPAPRIHLSAAGAG